MEIIGSGGEMIGEEAIEIGPINIIDMREVEE
jgi:hypothetical protein